MSKVFVYGSLKVGFANHGYLMKSKFLGEHITVDRFSMLDFNTYPALVFNKEGQQVSGELYEVSNFTFKALDLLEGYPSYYNRVEIKLLNFPEKVWVYYIKGRIEDLPYNTFVEPNKENILVWEE